MSFWCNQIWTVVIPPFVRPSKALFLWIKQMRIKNPQNFVLPKRKFWLKLNLRWRASTKVTFLDVLSHNSISFRIELKIHSTVHDLQVTLHIHGQVEVNPVHHDARLCHQTRGVIYFGLNWLFNASYWNLDWNNKVIVYVWRWISRSSSPATWQFVKLKLEFKAWGQAGSTLR